MQGASPPAPPLGPKGPRPHIPLRKAEWPKPGFLKISLLAALATITLEQQARAGRDPKPVPSGIVIHLFGPDSPAGPLVPPGTAPTTGNILHQMFITGDPDQKPGAALPRGKKGG
jgi:hypothetical protein